MKKILFVLFAFVLGGALVSSKAVLAATPNWDVTGTWNALHWYQENNYTHINNITEASDGTLTGNGGWNSYVNGTSTGNSNTWEVTNGSFVDGNTFHMNYNYTSSVTCNGYVDATINADGSMTGNWFDNCYGERTGLWTAAPGTAKELFFDWGSHVNASQCPNKVGKPIINITQKVVNDIDSGFNGYWAFDNNNRQIQVWKTSTNRTYCAVVRYEGQFKAKEGQNGPGLGYTTKLAGDEKGTFQGGYIAKIVGDLVTNPDWITNGSIGVYDYNCDIFTKECSGRVPWVSVYFSSVNTEDPSQFNQTWWGWIYHGGIYGTWINSINLNFGNIQ